MFLSLLNKLTQGSSRFPRRGRQGKAAKTGNAARLWLEFLEDRLAPATIRFSNPAGGAWGDPNNWSPAQVPAAADDATVDPQNITVAYNGSAADSVHSLTLSGPGSRLNFESGLLRVTSALQASNNFTLAIDGGQLSALSTVTGSASDVIVNGGGLLLAEGAITLSSNSTVTVNDGGRLTAQTTFAASGGSVTVNGGGTLTSNGLLTANNSGTVRLNGGSLSAFAGLTVSGGGTLTLDGGTFTVPSPGAITVNNGGRLNDNLGPLTNLAPLVNATLSLGAAVTGTFVCQGTCTLAGDSPAGSELDVQAVNGAAARLNVSAGANNFGTVRLLAVNSYATPVTLAVTGAGAFTNAPGGVIRSDYSVDSRDTWLVSGNLVNQGQVIAGNLTTLSTSGSLSNQGQISAEGSGAVSVGGGASDVYEEAGGTLSGGWLQGMAFFVSAAPASGTLALRGTCTLQGDNPAGTTLEVQAASSVAARLNVSAGANNYGTIHLLAVNSYATPVTLAVTGTGAFTNAPGGLISSDFTGDARNSWVVSGNLINQGQMIAATGTTLTTSGGLTNQGQISVEGTGAVSVGGGVYEEAGGTLSGGWLQGISFFVSAAPASGTLPLRGTCTLVGDNPVGCYLDLQAASSVAARLNVSAGANNFGTIRLLAANSAFIAVTLAVTGSGAFTNGPGGVIRSEVTGDARNSWIISGNLANQGQIIGGPSTALAISGGVFEEAGGTMTGNAYLQGISLRVTASPPTGQGSVQLRGTCTLLGDNLANTLLEVQADSSVAAQLNVPAGANNFGTIRLYSQNSAFIAVTLAVTGSGAFTNGPGGVIRSEVTGDSRDTWAVNGNLANQGQIIGGPSTALAISAGVYEEAGGTLSGGWLQGISFFVSAAPASGTLPLRGTCTLVGDNPVGCYLDLQAASSVAARLNVSAGANNFGTIRLYSQNSAFIAVTLAVTGTGAFTNAPGGVIRSDVTGDNRDSWVISGNLINQGQVIVASLTNLALSDPGFDYVNTGTVQLLGTTLTVTGNSLTNQPGGVVVGDGTLDVSGSGAAPFSNYGTVRVPAGNTLFIHGTFTNFSALDRRLSGGSYDVTGTLRFDNASLVTLDANVLLDGAGGSGGQVLPPAGSADALAGLAAITASGSLTVRNGRLIGTTTSPLAALRNDGSLAVGNASTVIVGTYTQGAAAVLDVNGGRLRVQTAFTNFAGGTLTGGVYRLTGTDSAHHGTLQFAGADVVTNAASVELDGPFAEVVDLTSPTPLDGLRDFAFNNGSFTVASGRSFTTGGDFTNNGALAVGAGSTFLVGGSLTNFEATTLTGGTWDLGGTLQFAGADVRTNAATLTLDGSGGRILDTSATPLNGLRNFAVNAAAGVFALRNGRSYNTPGDFTNNGTLDVGAGTAFSVVGSLINLQGTTLTGGTWLVRGTLRFTGAVQANAAAVVLDGPASAITNLQGVNALAGFATNAAGGSLTVQNGRTLALAGTLTNQGLVTVGPGGTLSVGAYAQTAGATALAAGGTLTAAGGVSLAQGSTLSGSGTVSGDVTNAGIINVGGAGAAGTLTIDGNFTQLSTGALNFAVGGYNAGSDFGQLVVTGQAALDGTLNVGLVNDFTPNPGDRFQVMAFAGASGAFATVNLPPGGMLAGPFDGWVMF